MKREDVKTVKDLDTYYSEFIRPIKFIEREKDSIKSVYDLIFLADSKSRTATKYIKSGKKQCGAFKNRSIHDICTLAKYYFPKFNTVDLLKAILLWKDTTVYTRLGYCPDIRKYNVWEATKDNVYANRYFSTYNIGQSSAAKILNFPNLQKGNIKQLFG